VTPAEFRYHPREAAPLFAEAPLPDGRRLLVGGRGERWTVSPREGAEAAPELAPEDLVAIVSSAGAFLFLGKSGTTYAADAPLGAFTRSSSPLSPLQRVRPFASGFMGIRRDGSLVRSDSGGAAFRPSGPEGVRFEDIAFGDGGTGLALAVPEALYQTRDGGVSFTRVNAPTFGAEGLVMDVAAGIVVRSPLGARRWDPASSTLSPLGRAPNVRLLSLGAPVPLGPSATALMDGHAVVIAGRWIEARSLSPGEWQLVTGTFGERLVAAPLSVARGCADVRLAGSTSALYLVCARQRAANVTQPLEVQRSTDSGRTFRIEPYVVEGQSAGLVMAVGPTGSLAISGVCPSATRGPGCRPMGVQVRRTAEGDAGRTVALVPAAVPSLAGAALGLGYSMDGRTLYAIGTRSKGESLAIFVSHDAGESFEPRDVESLSAASGGGPGTLESMAAAEDGTMSFVVSTRAGRAWLVADDDGRVVAASKPPIPTARLGAAGQRALAIDAASREAWESLDAGATWASLGKLRLDPCPGATACPMPVACVSSGCAVAAAVSRVGWGEPPRTPLLPVSPQGDATSRAVPRVGVTLSCALDPGEWRKLDNVTEPPSASAAAIGKVAWYAIRTDPSDASVSVVHVRTGAAAQVNVEEVRLLAPERHPEEVAYTFSNQIEGVVALRYPLPGLHGSRDPTLREVEVAWDNVLFGQGGHAVIRDGGAYRPGDYDNGKTRSKVARPALVSIASGGVYVRLHAALEDAQPAFFADGKSVELVPSVEWPEEARRYGHADIVHVGRAHVPLRIDFGTGTLLYARRAGESWAFDGVALGLSEPREFGVLQHVDIAYSGDRAGIEVLSSDPFGKEGRGLLWPLRGDASITDEPLAVPTQHDLPHSPRGCSPVERSASPRLVVPFQPGTRHPVLVTDPIEPMRVLLTGDAVLHGSPTSPCVAAYDADLVSSESGATNGEAAIVMLGSAEHSFLFRTKEATATLEYRTMTCRPDPAAEAPIEVFRERGTFVDPG